MSSSNEFGSINQKFSRDNSEEYDSIESKIIDLAHQNEIELIYLIFKENNNLDICNIIDKRLFTCNNIKI